MSDLKQQLDGLVGRIEKHQKALGLNDSQFVARYQRHLGSTRTWRERLIARDFKDLRADKWLSKLNTLVAELDGGTPVESVIEEMPPLRKLRRLYDMLQGQTNDRRCIVMLGVTGTGKTVSARAICNDPGCAARTAFVKARAGWNDSRLQIARGFARAVACGDDKRAAVCAENVIEHLKGNPLTVFVDDAHEGGVELMKFVKCLIDETRAKFVLLAYPTAWRRMIAASDDAHSEAQQLLGRTLKPVFNDYERGVTAKALTVFLTKAAGLNSGAERIANEMLELVRRNGNLRLVADAIENAQIAADDAGSDLEPQMIVDEVFALCGAERKEQR